MKSTIALIIVSRSVQKFKRGVSVWFSVLGGNPGLPVSGCARGGFVPSSRDGNRDSHDGCAGRLDQPEPAGRH
jgi:hypothetical protein